MPLPTAHRQCCRGLKMAVVVGTALVASTFGLRADDKAIDPSAAATPTSTIESPADSPATAPATPAAPTPAPAAVVNPATPLPIDQQPYRVLVAVGVAADVAVTVQEQSAVIRGLQQRIASRLGELWRADIELVDWLSPGRSSVLKSFSQADLNGRFLGSKYDKVFLATLEGAGTAVRTSALEWDQNSQTSTTMTSSLCYEPRVRIDRLLAEILAHFRPLASIEEIAEDGVSVSLRVRGGELAPPDRSLAPVMTGVFLRPYYRYLDRKKELRSLQPVPWTYLRIEEIDRGRAKATIESAFRGALAANRRRTELMAIAVLPRFESTAVRVYPRGQIDNPLSGTRVDVLNRHPTDDDKVEDRRTLYTGRSGEATVAVDAEHPLLYLYVMSGKSVLAVVPFIPGDLPQVELEVPDDGPRLSVEGEVALLEAELIEVVARREVTIARALGYARGNKWEQADKLVNEVKNLPTREVLKERLERIRLPAVAASRQTKNRVAETRINKLCQQLTETIDQHLPPDRISNFQTEIRELKEAS
ncbi:MAG: hypothetical protein ACK5Q5_01280 [Planctomycetaceae bacterium]